MRKLEDLMGRFAKIGLEEKQIKTTIIEILKDRFGTELHPDEILIQKNKVTIKKTGPFKSEIMMNKKDILERLNKELDFNVTELY